MSDETEIDSNDLNQDGVVTRDEIEKITSESRPPSFLEQLQQATLNALRVPGGWGLPGIVPMMVSGTMDSRDWQQRDQALKDQYPNADAAGQVADDVTNGEPPDPTSDDKGSGYLGVDDMLDAEAVASVTGEDGVVRYYVDTKDGAREVQYKNADPYKVLAEMGPSQLREWRRTMWLGGYMEPDSFVGAVTADDLTALKNAMTEANMTGVTWQDAIASRVEMGQRYGRPITEAEIMELDDEVPGLIKQYAQKNGITVSDDFIAKQQRRVLNGKDTPESVLEKLRDTYVKPLYPQFERELDQGLTVEDIASPYIDMASSMLEIPTNQLGITDPIIKNVLQARDDAGQPTRQPIWKFQEQVTNDPRWKYTNNAYQAYGSALSGMLSEMGL